MISIEKLNEEERFDLVQYCKYFFISDESAPRLWHKSYCLINHNTEFYYEHCELMWLGKCPYKDKI